MLVIPEVRRQKQMPGPYLLVSCCIAVSLELKPSRREGKFMRPGRKRQKKNEEEKQGE